MQEGIEFLTKKMAELDAKANIVGRNKSNYDEYCDLVEKITFLDELIDEMKKITQKKIRKIGTFSNLPYINHKATNVVAFFLLFKLNNLIL